MANKKTKQRKKTPNQKAWDKAIKSIKGNINYLKNRGYIVPDTVLPNKPKTIRKRDLKRIAKINRESIALQSEFKNPQTGLIIKGQKGYDLFKQIEKDKREYAKKKKEKEVEKRKRIKEKLKPDEDIPTYEDIILNTIEGIINDWTPSPNWSKYWAGEKAKTRDRLKNMLDNAIRTEGRNVVARRLQGRATDVINIAENALYASKQEIVEFAITEFASILKGDVLSLNEALELGEMELEEEDFDV